MWLPKFEVLTERDPLPTRILSDIPWLKFEFEDSSIRSTISISMQSNRLFIEKFSIIMEFKTKFLSCRFDVDSMGLST